MPELTGHIVTPEGLINGSLRFGTNIESLSESTQADDRIILPGMPSMSKLLEITLPIPHKHAHDKTANNVFRKLTFNILIRQICNVGK